MNAEETDRIDPNALYACYRVNWREYNNDILWEQVDYNDVEYVRGAVLANHFGLVSNRNGVALKYRERQVKCFDSKKDALEWMAGVSPNSYDYIGGDGKKEVG